jgi:hypothetical protein
MAGTGSAPDPTWSAGDDAATLNGKIRRKNARRLERKGARSAVGRAERREWTYRIE